MESIKKFGGKVAAKCKELVVKIKDWAKTVNWKVVYDKVTTGLLIFLLTTPFLILLYIILWFVLK